MTFNKGDIILVAYDSYMFPAIYDKLTKSGNHMYWLSYSSSEIENAKMQIERNKKVYGHFINRKQTVIAYPIAKVTLTDLSLAHQDLINEMISLLKSTNQL